jgi:hypothetical protein
LMVPAGLPTYLLVVLSSVSIEVPDESRYYALTSISKPP